MDNLGYLVAAYSIIWLAIAGYVFSLSIRQRRLRREIDLIKTRLGREKGNDPGEVSSPKVNFAGADHEREGSTPRVKG